MEESRTVLTITGRCRKVFCRIMPGRVPETEAVTDSSSGQCKGRRQMDGKSNDRTLEGA